MFLIGLLTLGACNKSKKSGSVIGGQGGGQSPSIVCAPFSFADKTNVGLSSIVESEPVIISDCDDPVAVSISGEEGDPQVVINGAVAAPGATAKAGDTVRVRFMTSSLPGQDYSATLTVGSVSADFAASSIPVKLALGGTHSCALLADQTVKCWGVGSSGQLGQGVNTSSMIPVAVSGLTGVVDLASGVNHSCALLDDGKVKCWGGGGQGQLGNGLTSNSNLPVLVHDLVDTRAVFIGYYFSCAIVGPNNSAKCWGQGTSGQLGNGIKSDSSFPVDVVGLSDIKALVPSQAANCALLEDRSLKCWGSNSFGQLGIGTTVESLIPVSVSGLSAIASVDSYRGHYCAVLADKSVKCWGDNANGMIGDGTSGSIRLLPTAVLDVPDAISVSLGTNFSCAVTSDHSRRCWGTNTSGQFGNNTMSSSNNAVLISDFGQFVNIGPAGSHTCGVSSDESIKCWGYGGGGRLGTGDPNHGTGHSLVPVSVINL